MWIVPPVVVIAGSTFVARLLRDTMRVGDDIRDEVARLDAVRAATGALDGGTALASDALDAMRRR